MNSCMTVKIPIVEADEAPVVMRHADYSGKIIEYRWFRNRLFVKMQANDFNSSWAGESSAEMLIPRFRSQRVFGVVDDAAAKKEVRAKARGYFILDGAVWWRKGEPRYCIYTFGLGHNHAETCLSIDTHFNSNISKERYFSALDYDAAVAKAVEIAQARGDTASIDRIKRSRKIEVLDPKAVKVKPRSHKGGSPIIDQAETLIEGSSCATEAALLLMATMS